MYCYLPVCLQISMLTYLSSYLAMASAFYYVIFEGVMSVLDPGFHDYFIPHSFDVSQQQDMDAVGQLRLTGGDTGSDRCIWRLQPVLATPESISAAWRGKGCTFKHCSMQGSMSPLLQSHSTWRVQALDHAPAAAACW